MAEQEMEILQGTIRAVVYQNYDNGYAVLRLGVGGGQAVTVVGTIPLPAVGERLMVTGRWSSHASYGRQFEAEFLERLMPETSLEILNYLSSRVIKGIGPKMAARIVEHFGDQTLQIMEREPVRLAEVSGISRDRAKAIGEDMRGGQPTPGNIAGGLSSIEEKSLGAIVKSGHRPIQGVLEYCDRVDGQKGLWIKDAPGREPEILTGMAATGAQFMMFSTGRGAPQGFPSMPVIKICGNPNTYERMQHDMDLNAGRIITGEKTIEEVGEEAFQLMLQVLSGQMTKNEALGYFGSMDIFCLGPVI